jgi:hypothetical protein
VERASDIPAVIDPPEPAIGGVTESQLKQRAEIEP